VGVTVAVTLGLVSEAEREPTDGGGEDRMTRANVRRWPAPAAAGLAVLVGCSVLALDSFQACGQDADPPGGDADEGGTGAGEPAGADPHPPGERGHVRAPLPSDEELAELPGDGGPEFNRLVFESSPYLLQHARNPVDWYPWGDEAFAKARREDKPVFLSVGYSTCHWCHVMERESFESEEVAALMNEHFVSIKVDREERPDVDNIYMTAVRAMTGRGGWPMSVFLTPDRRPFWGGTYFPPEDRLGRPGFKSILRQLADAWEGDRESVLAGADQITRHLRARAAPPGREVELGAATLAKGYDQYERAFDPQHGGFGRAPKFPRSHSLSFLLRYGRRAPEADTLTMVRETLDHMARGGMRDHLGGGFHRYSTDREWLVPHFEKMLYDQALLARTYLEAYQVTGDERYAAVARDTFRYVLRDMTDPGGGFYSAEDADSEGEEGKFYVWTRAEVLEVLGEEDGEVFCAVYGVTEDGNYAEEATGEVTGANILHLPRALSAAARDLEADGEVLEERLQAMRERLFAVRERRIHPLKDDKILTDWNGLMISALAYGGQALGEDRYTQAARDAAEFITGTMLRDGRLLHRFRRGDASIKAYLDDYAFLAMGLLDLYETTFEVRWLSEARRLAREMLRLFWDADQSAFLFSAADGEELITETKELYDGAVPSGNSVATLLLLRLGRLTTDAAFTEAADETMEHFSAQIDQHPMGFPFMLMALDFAVGPSREIVLAGDPAGEGVRAMSRAVHRRFLPTKVLALHPAGEGAEEVRALVPFLEQQRAIDGRGTAYVCEDYTCKRPTTDVDQLISLLEER